MSDRICECDHPESLHVASGHCTKELAKAGDQQLKFCQCEHFKPKREDFSQAAARIVREATDDH